MTNKGRAGMIAVRAIGTRDAVATAKLTAEIMIEIETAEQRGEHHANAIGKLRWPWRRAKNCPSCGRTP